MCGAVALDGLIRFEERARGVAVGPSCQCRTLTGSRWVTVRGVIWLSKDEARQIVVTLAQLIGTGANVQWITYDGRL